MIKIDELCDPDSCMNRAKDDEMTFVLLGRDAAAPLAIRTWVDERVRLGKNNEDDTQILEALNCARIMELYRLVEAAMTDHAVTPQSERAEPTLAARKTCAEWLAYCLSLGWHKAQLDELEALWWKYHDNNGRPM